MQYIIFTNILNLTINKNLSKILNSRDIGQYQMLCHFILANN